MTMTISSFTTRLAATCLILFTCVVTNAPAQSAPAAVTVPVARGTSAKGKAADGVNRPRSFVLHLPGIGGRRGLDRALVRGLTAGGFDANDTYDWTENDPGLNALLAIERNHRQARRVAEMLTTLARANPTVRIHLVAHSGGTGIAIWALEALPADVRVYNLVLLASALSPEYDFSKALAHVEHRAYAFTSLNDTLVLKVGTQLFGTIDGHKVPAGGWGGFVVPPDADAKQYAKLVQYPYDPAWLKYGNLGDHIGPMMTAFAKEVLAPLMLADVAPPKSPPATRPAMEAPRGKGAGGREPVIETVAPVGK
jgi:pimeloyl-ACP methyl ester carboxylesterase